MPLVSCLRLAPGRLSALLLGLAGAAHAQTGDPSRLAQCAAIGASTDRLACYDALAGRAAPPAAVAASSAAPPVTSKLAPVDTTPAQSPQSAAQGGSLLSKFWELDPADKRGTFNVVGYRANYILPLHYTSRINRSPQSPTQAAVAQPDYKHIEAKIQLSLRTKLAQDVLLPGGDLWAGYTQQSMWQVWNHKDSKPFRNTDYEAELMYVVPVPEGLRVLPFGWQWRFAQLALAHQSNGQSDPLSRSWNRSYLGTGFERGDWSLVARFNHRFKEDLDSDNNPDLTRYRGRTDLQLNWAPGVHTFSLLWRSAITNVNRGAVQLEWTMPVYRDRPNGIRWFMQVFSGYGETLTDYNFRQTSVGAGVSFLQF
jgi:phospholipase A1